MVRVRVKGSGFLRKFNNTFVVWVDVGAEFVVRLTTTIAVVNKVLRHEELWVFTVALFRVNARWGSSRELMV